MNDMASDENRLRKRETSKGFRVLVGTAWVGGIAIAGIAWRWSGIPLVELPASLAGWLDSFGAWRGGFLFLLLYAVRPLVFFPSSLFTLSAGVLFGPWIGMLMTTMGENLGANFAFHLARMLGQEKARVGERRLFQGLDEKLRLHGTQVVTIFRLVYLPYDTVSYGCGLTSVKARHFLVGTLIGSTPYIVTFSLLGGAGSARLSGNYSLLGMDVSQRVAVLILSSITFVIGMILAVRLRRTHRGLIAATHLPSAM